MDRIDPGTLTAYKKFLTELNAEVKAEHITPEEAELQRFAWTAPKPAPKKE
jgi:hypothetical protein